MTFLRIETVRTLAERGYTAGELKPPILNQDGMLLLVSSKDLRFTQRVLISGLEMCSNTPARLADLVIDRATTQDKRERDQFKGAEILPIAAPPRLLTGDELAVLQKGVATTPAKPTIFERWAAASPTPAEFEAIEKRIAQSEAECKRAVAEYWYGEPVLTAAGDVKPAERGPGIAALKLPSPRPTLDMSDWADDLDCLADEA